jgi:hypothetical protein
MHDALLLVGYFAFVVLAVTLVTIDWHAQLELRRKR